MAQSIYVTLDTLSTETSVPEVKDKNGKIIRANMGAVNHTLPRSNYPTVEVFDDEEKFLAWAQERGALLSLLQEGVSSRLIGDRAAFKQPVKGIWSPEIGQANVNDRKWTVSTRPENVKSDEQKALEALSKLSPAQIAEMLSKMNK